MDESTIEYTENNGVHRKIIRPEVASFAIEMEATLRENDHKSGWDELGMRRLHFRIKQEFEEFEAEYADYTALCGHCKDKSVFLDKIQNMRKEAIDIANFCMFLCHNYPKRR